VNKKRPQHATADATAELSLALEEVNMALSDVRRMKNELAELDDRVRRPRSLERL
jgi:hypothetical protein